MATTENTKSKSTTPAADEFDRKDFARTLALVKAEVNGIIADSLKVRPLYSRTTEEAVAKRDAVVKSFSEFLTMIDGIKKNA